MQVGLERLETLLEQQEQEYGEGQNTLAGGRRTAHFLAPRLPSGHLLFVLGPLGGVADMPIEPSKSDNGSMDLIWGSNLEWCPELHPETKSNFCLNYSCRRW